MLSRFFIHRPVLAWVIAIVVMLIGALSIRTLSVEQYPNVAPPSIRITATYPGASADTLATTVTQVIEQDMTGIDNLMYMSSTSSSAGTATITLTFKSGTNADVAAMQVQNKVQEANASLPSAVQQQGIQVSKTAGNILMVVSVTSTDGRMNTVDLGNLLATRVQDPLTQISGVGQVTLFSAQHSMRVWLDPVKLRSVGLMPSDVTTAIDSQNAQLSVGQIGGAPQTKTQAINATIVTRGFLKTSDEFANILLRVNQDGSRVYLKDVGTVEVGGDSYDMTSRLNGKPAAAMGIMLASGANALSVAKAVRAQLAVLQKQMPGGVQLSVPHDTTPFVSASISEVITTLFEAVVLVFLVMYLFLGNLRATLIPTIVVPVALLGTFALIAAVGFTINVLSLFALVLAIGLLVDDAIVVVENVERLLSEGLAARCDHQGDGRDRRRIDRRHRRADGRVHSDGVHVGLDGRDLSSVLAHDHVGDGALRAARADAHARAVRDAAAPGRSATSAARLLRVVRAHIRRRHAPLRACSDAPRCAPAALDGRVCGDLRRGRAAVLAASIVVPAG